MRLVTDVDLPGTPESVMPWLETLDAYPAWMGLVYRATPEQGSEPAAWQVDLRARLGPLARSKRLRMERVVAADPHVLEFRRSERDGREHGQWMLRAEISPLPGEHAVTHVRVTLHYEGAHWASGLLERVLHDEIEQSKVRLTDLVSAGGAPGPTH